MAVPGHGTLTFAYFAIYMADGFESRDGTSPAGRPAEESGNMVEGTGQVHGGKAGVRVV